MTKPEIKAELEALQSTDFSALEYDYDALNKLRFKYDYLQMQIMGLQLIESLEQPVEVTEQPAE